MSPRYRCIAPLWVFGSRRGLTYVSLVLYICIVTTEMTPERLRAALAANGGNIAATSRDLGISRATLYRWMRLHAVQVGKRVLITEEAA